MKNEIKKFILYLLRWQLSTPILYIVMYFLPMNTLIKTIIANLIGAAIFFWVDRYLFSDKKNRKEKKISK